MNKKLMLIAALLIMPMLLAACGGSDMDPADAETGLEAVFRGDWDTADDFICEEEIEAAREDFDQEMLDAMGDLELDVACEKDGDAMSCTLTVMGQETTVRANIDDGKLCGLDE